MTLENVHVWGYHPAFVVPKAIYFPQIVLIQDIQKSTVHQEESTLVINESLSLVPLHPGVFYVGNNRHGTAQVVNGIHLVSQEKGSPQINKTRKG